MIWHLRDGHYGLVKSIRESPDQPTIVVYEVHSIGLDGMPDEYMAEYGDFNTASAKLDLLNVFRETIQCLSRDDARVPDIRPVLERRQAGRRGRAMTIEKLRDGGRGVAFVAPDTSGYRPCPEHPASELLCVRMPNGQEAVVCYEAWCGQGCKYISRRRAEKASLPDA